MPAEELRQWWQFDRQCGLPDIADQWQRALMIASKARSGSDPSTFMPLMAWNQKQGPDVLLGKLKHGKI
tara:strand:- start:556 stop:762 length:207 start_codon:yes stop_codon:yes gene_type:complete